MLPVYAPGWQTRLSGIAGALYSIAYSEKDLPRVTERSGSGRHPECSQIAGAQWNR